MKTNAQPLISLRVLLLAAGVVALVVGLLLNAVGHGSTTVKPTLAQLNRTVLSNLPGEGIARVECAMPSPWEPGNGSTCSTFGAAGNSRGTVFITVRPSNGDRWNIHMVYSGVS